jgi:hypothetical protein
MRKAKTIKKARLNLTTDDLAIIMGSLSAVRKSFAGSAAHDAVDRAMMYKIGKVIAKLRAIMDLPPEQFATDETVDITSAMLAVLMGGG